MTIEGLLDLKSELDRLIDDFKNLQEKVQDSINSTLNWSKIWDKDLEVQFKQIGQTLILEARPVAILRMNEKWKEELEEMDGKTMTEKTVLITLPNQVEDVDYQWLKYTEYNEPTMQQRIGLRNDALIIDGKRVDENIHPQNRTKPNPLPYDCDKDRQFALCKVSIKQGAYIRFHLSKGWSKYILETKKGLELIEDNTVSEIRVWERNAIVASKLELPFMATYSLDGKKKEIRVNLPSWWDIFVKNRPISKEKKSFSIKIIEFFNLESTELEYRDEMVNEWAWTRKKGRNELIAKRGDVEKWMLKNRIPVQERKSGIIMMEVFIPAH